MFKKMIFQTCYYKNMHDMQIFHGVSFRRSNWVATQLYIIIDYFLLYVKLFLIYF